MGGQYMFPVQELLFILFTWTKNNEMKKACRKCIHIQLEFEFEIKHSVYVGKQCILH